MMFSPHIPIPCTYSCRLVFSIIRNLKLKNMKHGQGFNAMETCNNASSRGSNWWQKSKSPLRDNINIYGLEIIIQWKVYKRSERDNKNKLHYSVERQPLKKKCLLQCRSRGEEEEKEKRGEGKGEEKERRRKRKRRCSLLASLESRFQ